MAELLIPTPMPLNESFVVASICVRACVRECVRACVRACVCVCACKCVCVCINICNVAALFRSCAACNRCVKRTHPVIEFYIFIT